MLNHVQIYVCVCMCVYKSLMKWIFILKYLTRSVYVPNSRKHSFKKQKLNILTTIVTKTYCKQFMMNDFVYERNI